MVLNLFPKLGNEDTNITFEDQQMINTFARKNAKLTEIKDEIEEKKVNYKLNWCGKVLDEGFDFLGCCCFTREGISCTCKLKLNCF